MKWKRYGGLLFCMLLLFGTKQAAFALENGVYTGSVVTSYYNPDTGNVDDGGSANAALGEGMCRSATDTVALVEVNGDDVWITLRLLLQSNCNNVKLYTRTDYDTYAPANFSITAENAELDAIDYRFKVSSADVKLKATMYVTPMGRDVLWYLNIDTSTLKAGSGDFVVSIDTSQPAAAPAPSAPATPAAATTPAQSVAPAPSAPGIQSGTAQAQSPAQKSASTPAVAGQDTTSDTTDTAEPEADTAADAQTEEDAGTSTAKRVDSKKTATGTTAANTAKSARNQSQGASVELIAAIVLLIIAAIGAGACIYVVRKRGTS